MNKNITIRLLYLSIINPPAGVCDRSDCCKYAKHTLYEFILLFFFSVNSCSDYACSAHKEKCNPQCHVAVIASLRRIGVLRLRRFCRCSGLRSVRIGRFHTYCAVRHCEGCGCAVCVRKGNVSAFYNPLIKHFSRRGRISFNGYNRIFFCFTVCNFCCTILYCNTMC